MQRPLAFLDAAAIEEVPISLWKSLFEAIGSPPTLGNGELTHADIVRSLTEDAPTDELLLALEAVHQLGTEEGREAIVEALADQDTQLDAKGSGPRELALQLFLCQREAKDAALKDAFVRAQIRIQVTGKKARYDEFLGVEARQVNDLKARVDDLRNSMVVYCKDNDLGDHVDVVAFNDEGSVVVQVIHSHRARKPLAVVPGDSRRTMIEFRPVHCDVLRYDTLTGRLRVYARAASLIKHYRGLMGKILFDDPAFFVGGAYSLKPLQDRGQEVLNNHTMPQVARVRVTEILWDLGDREVVHIRSRDCFARAQQLGLDLTAGDFIEVKMKVLLVRQSTRPVTVTLRAPSRMSVTDRTQEEVIDQYLQQIGVRTRADPDFDLWSILHAPQDMHTWRRVLGVDSDRLVTQGVLVKTTLSTVVHPDTADNGPSLAAERTPDGRLYGVSLRDDLDSRTLTPTDVDGASLNFARFASFLRTTLQLSHPSADLRDPALIRLGRMEFDALRFEVLLALEPGLPSKLTLSGMQTNGARVVVLVPMGRTVDVSPATLVPLDPPIPDRPWLERAILEATGLESQVPAIRSAPKGARLVIDKCRGKVWVDGIEISGLKPETHPYRLVLALAEASPNPVRTIDLVRQLSPARRDDTAVARKAKTEAKSTIVEALAEQGIDLVDDPFTSNKRGCYRCNLASFVR